jgi:hypothetical protein
MANWERGNRSSKPCGVWLKPDTDPIGAWLEPDGEAPIKPDKAR